MPSGDSPSVSVVIATFNGSATLAAQLESITSQAYSGPLEVIIADNGSYDGTVALAESFSERLDVRIVDASAQRGQCYARNLGASVAKGELILFLDQDDVVAPGYAQAMVRSLCDYEMVGARIDCDSLNPGWIANSRRPAQVQSLGAALGYLPYAGGQTLGIRREAFEEVGGFDPAMPGAVEDVDLCWKVQLAGFTLGYAGDAVVRYRYRDTLRAQVTQAFSYGRAEVTLYSRYRDLGMKRRSTRQALVTWLVWGRNVTRARSKGDLAKLIWKLSHDIGMAVTCARLKVYYP